MRRQQQAHRLPEVVLAGEEQWLRRDDPTTRFDLTEPEVRGPRQAQCLLRSQVRPGPLRPELQELVAQQLQELVLPVSLRRPQPQERPGQQQETQRQATQRQETHQLPVTPPLPEQHSTRQRLWLARQAWLVSRPVRQLAQLLLRPRLPSWWSS